MQLIFHTPWGVFRVPHSLEHETLADLYNKLNKKENTGYDDGAVVRKGWLHYEYDGELWQLNDEIDYQAYVQNVASTGAGIPIHFHDPSAPLPPESERYPAFRSQGYRRHTSPTANLTLEFELSRLELVKDIVERLRVVNFIQLCGGPASGKSLLLIQMSRYLMQLGADVILMTEIWPTDPQAQSSRRQELIDYQREARVRDIETFLLIDEGQATYSDDQLWNDFFKQWGADVENTRLKILIACAYGNVGTHAVSLRYTPMWIEKISLRPTEGCSLQLLLNRSEMEQLILTAVDKKHMPPIDQELFDWIFTWTAGYISVVMAFVRIFGARKQRIRDQEVYTMEDFRNDCPPESLFSTLAGYGPCQRFLPNPTFAGDARIFRVFSQLLVEEEIDYDPVNPASSGLNPTDFDFAHARGLLYTERSSSGTLTISFAFPLQRSLLQTILLPPIPDLLEDIPTLFSLVTQVVQRFNPDHLLTPRRVGGSPQDRPLDATYQHEFYRCLYQLRPRALMSAEYASASGSRIDFLVHRDEHHDNQRSWGIELLRDGDRIHEHAHRFEPSGQYHSIVSDSMTKFIIIDFRTNIPSRTYPLIKDLIHVVFDRDFDRCHIYDNNNVPSGSYILKQVN
ncbi:hypothetical protein C8R45DRAFT_997364 [Mycena sanguinolenta]|nr:hypothetical protein C8R45DRAFT_997364 [Mycena sanguinolenta]